MNCIRANLIMYLATEGYALGAAGLDADVYDFNRAPLDCGGRRWGFTTHSARVGLVEE